MTDNDDDIEREFLAFSADAPLMEIKTVEGGIWPNDWEVHRILEKNGGVGGAGRWNRSRVRRLASKLQDKRSRKPDIVTKKSAYAKQNPERARNRQRSFRRAHPEVIKQNKRRENERTRKAVLARDFVAIDSEGCNTGKVSVHNGTTYREHRSVLWLAGNDKEIIQLCTGDKQFVSSARTCEWLTTQAAPKFSNKIVVSFAFNYDVAQIFADVPDDKRWEIVKGLWLIDGDKNRSMDQRTMPNVDRYWILADKTAGYAISYLKGKWFSIAKLRDPRKPRHYYKNRVGVERSVTDIVPGSRIKIFDVFGFFQSDFVKAYRSLGHDVASPEEDTLIVEGKKMRLDFRTTPIDKIVRYTSAEICVLARMMEKIRGGLERLGLRLANWYGPGAISSAIMKKHDVQSHYPIVRCGDISEQQEWAHHAFFGGRTEMIQQGVHTGVLHNYDLSSAYPSALLTLPSMKLGDWQYCDFTRGPIADRFGQVNIDPPQLNRRNERQGLVGSSLYLCTDAQLQAMQSALANMSSISMVHILWCLPHQYVRIEPRPPKLCADGSMTVAEVRYRADIPLYPFPFRGEDGSIVFPSEGEGIYVVEEVRAALRSMRRMFHETDIRPNFAMIDAWEFVPASDDKPFAFVQEIFDERARICAESGTTGIYSIVELVLKLALNSIYGKLAQRIGARKDKHGDLQPPTLANPFYAAATTAWCRARVLDATSERPHAIVNIATDGITSTEPLTPTELIDGGAQLELLPILSGLRVVNEKHHGKLLETWTYDRAPAGIFVKSGVYGLSSGDTDKPPKTRMRGVKADTPAARR